MISRENQTWTEIESWLIDRIVTLRIQNDNVCSDAVQTAILRGKIAAFKELLALPDKKEAKVEEYVPYE